MTAGAFWLGSLAGRHAAGSDEFDEEVRAGRVLGAFMTAVVEDSTNSSAVPQDGNCEEREPDQFVCWVRWSPFEPPRDLMYYGMVERRNGGDLVVLKIRRFEARR